MADGKITRAELAEAVRELREEVARLRAGQVAQHCHCGPGCVTVPVVLPPPPSPPVWVQPYWVTCGDTTGINPYRATTISGGGSVSPPGSGYTVSASN